MFVKIATQKEKKHASESIRLMLAIIPVVIAVYEKSVQAQSISITPGNTGIVLGQPLIVNGGNTTNLNTTNLLLNSDPGSSIGNLVRSIISGTQSGNVSIINDAIQVTGGNSNSFLINPVGRVFRLDATSLNVSNAFLTRSTELAGFGVNGVNAVNFNNSNALVAIPNSLAAASWRSGTTLNLSSPSAPPIENGQMAVTVLPKQDLVRLDEPGRLLSLEIPSPVLNSSQSPIRKVSNAILPQLLTGGTGHNATDLIVRNGTIQLIGSGIATPTYLETASYRFDRFATKATTETLSPSDRKSSRWEETALSPLATPTSSLLANAPCLDTGIIATETQLSQIYQPYLSSSSNQPAVNSCSILNTIQKSTGIKTAILYGTFLPGSLKADSGQDQLELVLVSSQGTPIRRRIPGATREKVTELAQIFRREVADPSKTDSESYKPSAQQLYQWLITPMEADLNTGDIQNITFVLDTQLSSLPLAALYDGVHQQFLIQKYSIGLMPNLSLTDTRYRDIRRTQVLAMGRSTFTDSNQAPLPAVPIELSLITNTLWSGKLFLNQGFTLENLKVQHQQQSFGIIHLATHGEFKPEPMSEYSGLASSEKSSKSNPLLPNLSRSYIQLWDTKLRLNQLRQLRLDNPPVELLVLSACRTAVGDTQTELGFAGLAVQVGVKSVLASLWYVSDAGTLGLVTEFYQQLKTAPIKAEALRQTQIAMLNHRVHIQRHELRWTGGKQVLPPDLPKQADLSHPYYWAGFTLVGNPW